MLLKEAWFYQVIAFSRGQAEAREVSGERTVQVPAANMVLSLYLLLYPIPVPQPSLDYCPDGGPGIVRGIERQGWHDSLPVTDAAICPQQSPTEKGGCPGEQVEAGLVLFQVDPLQMERPGSAGTGSEGLNVYARPRSHSRP